MSLFVDVHRNFGSFRLDMSFSSDAARIGILGASGCGKSMTLKSIAGLVKPEKGSVLVNDRVLFDSEKKINVTPQKRRVGYLFQNCALFPNMNVEANIEAGLSGLPRKERRERAVQMMETFGLKGLGKRFPDQLSGGQQQRCALARIMAASPDVILLDEPFSALDAPLSERLQEEMLRILSGYHGITVLVSHSREEICRFSQECFFMNDGKLDGSGKTAEVFRHPPTRTAAVLAGIRNITPVRRLDAHRVLAPGWGTVLCVKKEVSPDYGYAACRADSLIPVYGPEKENCIPFRAEYEEDLPGRHICYINPGRQGKCTGEDVLTWSVPQPLWEDLCRKGRPDWLQIGQEDLIWLK